MRIAAAVALLLLVAGSASGQLGGRHPPRRTIEGGFGACEASGSLGPRLLVATDGLTATDCTAGEGVTAALCWCDGSAWVPLLSAGGDVSSVFTRTGAVVAAAGDYDAALIDYTPADGADWTDPDPTTLEQVGDDLAARVTDDEAALSSHAGNADAHHARDHAGAHALGGADALTVTTLASGCTDAEVLGGTAAGTGVECQAAGGGSAGFDALTSGTNTTAAMVVGTGASLAPGGGSVLATALNPDADANTEASCTATGCIFDLNDDGITDLNIERASQYLVRFTDEFGSVPMVIGRNAGTLVIMTGLSNNGPAIKAANPSATVPVLLPLLADPNTGIGWAAGDDGRLIAGAASSLGWTATETTMFVEQVNSAYARTCADSADGNPGTLVAAVSGATYLELTGSDADGCAVTLSETGATRGQRIEAVVVATAGGTLNFADTTGVQETGAGCSLSLYGTATFRYIGDRHVLVACTPSN